MGRYQKGKTNLDFTEARDSEWQWHQLTSFCQVLKEMHTKENWFFFLPHGVFSLATDIYHGPRDKLDLSRGPGIHAKCADMAASFVAA